MGSQISSDSQQFIQVDPTEGATIVDKTQSYTVYQNSKGGQYEKYVINRQVEQQKNHLNQTHYSKQFTDQHPSFQEHYQYRLTHRFKYFVELLYAAPKENSFTCNFTSVQEYEVVTERILHRLSDVYNLSFTNAITVLNVALKGFRNLYTCNGLLWVKDTMIGVNQSNEVKVWLNSNFAINYIEQLPVSLINLNSQQQQDVIVSNLIDMISSKTFPSPEWKHLMKLRMDSISSPIHQSIQQNLTNKMTFDLAIQMVEILIKKYNLQDLKDSNRVYDLFNERNSQSMKRQHNQHVSFNEIKQFHVGVQQSLDNNQMRGQHMKTENNKSQTSSPSGLSLHNDLNKSSRLNANSRAETTYVPITMIKANTINNNSNFSNSFVPKEISSVNHHQNNNINSYSHLPTNNNFNASVSKNQNEIIMTSPYRIQQSQIGPSIYLNPQQPIPSKFIQNLKIQPYQQRLETCKLQIIPQKPSEYPRQVSITKNNFSALKQNIIQPTLQHQSCISDRLQQSLKQQIRRDSIPIFENRHALISKQDPFEKVERIYENRNIFNGRLSIERQSYQIPLSSSNHSLRQIRKSITQNHTNPTHTVIMPHYASNSTLNGINSSLNHRENSNVSFIKGNDFYSNRISPHFDGNKINPPNHKLIKMDRSNSCRQTISQSPQTQTMVRFNHSQDKPIIQGRLFNRPPSMSKVNFPNSSNSLILNGLVYKNGKQLKDLQIYKQNPQRKSLVQKSIYMTQHSKSHSGQFPFVSLLNEAVIEDASNTENSNSLNIKQQQQQKQLEASIEIGKTNQEHMKTFSDQVTNTLSPQQLKIKQNITTNTYKEDQFNEQAFHVTINYCPTPQGSRLSQHDNQILDESFSQSSMSMRKNNVQQCHNGKIPQNQWHRHIKDQTENSKDRQVNNSYGDLYNFAIKQTQEIFTQKTLQNQHPHLSSGDKFQQKSQNTSHQRFSEKQDIDNSDYHLENNNRNIQSPQIQNTHQINGQNGRFSCVNQESQTIIGKLDKWENKLQQSIDIRYKDAKNPIGLGQFKKNWSQKEEPQPKFYAFEKQPENREISQSNFQNNRLTPRIQYALPAPNVNVNRVLVPEVQRHADLCAVPSSWSLNNNLSYKQLRNLLRSSATNDQSVSNQDNLMS